MKRLCLFFALTWQMACTTLTDQGNELFEKGLFQEAETTYTAALVKDPNDAEALAGQQKARVKILDVGLIEVRMLRLANNFLQASDKLEVLLGKQNDWKVRFNSGMAQSQEDETNKAKEFLLREMANELGAGFPERSFYLGYTHPNILQNTGSSFEFEQIQSKVIAAGQKRCTELQAMPGAKEVFLRSFVKRHCNVFGVAWSPASVVNDPWLYSSVQFKNQFKIQKQNYDGILSADELESSLIRSFEKSPYFNTESNKPLALVVNGSMVYNDRQRKEKRRKTYQVEEKRVETSISKDANGKDKEDKVEKTRRVPKNFDYFVTVHEESAQLTSTVTGTVAQKAFRSHFQKSAQRKSESHNVRNDAADITPQDADLMNVEKWMNQEGEAAAQTFTADLNRTWAQHFCGMVGDVGDAQVMKAAHWENLERCGRVEAAHAAVNSFYRTQFHLSYSELWMVLEAPTAPRSGRQASL